MARGGTVRPVVEFNRPGDELSEWGAAFMPLQRAMAEPLLSLMSDQNLHAEAA